MYKNMDVMNMRRQLYWARTYGGPGPSEYKLPTTVGHNGHDPSKYRSPSYSFGRGAAAGLSVMRPESRGGLYSPGQATRQGLSSSPAWSFGGRPPVMPQRTRVVVSVAAGSTPPARQREARGMYKPASVTTTTSTDQ